MGEAIIDDRRVESVTETQDLDHHPIYTFHLPSVGDGRGWSKKTEIRLERIPSRDGTYPMFVMGLATYARADVPLSELRTPMGLLYNAWKCVDAAKKWWDSNG